MKDAGETMPFQYALLRVVPRVERGEFINAGVVLYCQDAGFLDALVRLDEDRLRALDPECAPSAVRRHLEAVRRICAGGPGGGPVGLLPKGERFGWLAAPRSTVVQSSPIHTGLTADPAGELERLLGVMVATGRADPPG